MFFPPQKRAFDPFLVTVASFPCGKVPSPPLTDCVALVKCLIQDLKGFPGGSVVKELTCNAGDSGSIPWSGRSPGGGNGNPFQDSCLENPMDRGAWQAAVHGVA